VPDVVCITICHGKLSSQPQTAIFNMYAFFVGAVVSYVVLLHQGSGVSPNQLHQEGDFCLEEVVYKKVRISPPENPRTSPTQHKKEPQALPEHLWFFQYISRVPTLFCSRYTPAPPFYNEGHSSSLHHFGRCYRRRCSFRPRPRCKRYLWPWLRRRPETHKQSLPGFQWRQALLWLR
jgi:hypothetical protein